MRRVLLGLGIALSAVFLAGCPPTYPKCQTDENCKSQQEVCVQGQCQQCATDQHCQQGFVCQANKCVPKPECRADADCGAGRTCQNGTCQLAPGGCVSDADCGEGSCRNNRCMPKGTCQADGDCGDGESCREGRCVQAAAQCNWDQPVLFGFNEYTLSAEAQEQLRSMADCIRDASGTVTLEGHADERGTEEYNLQLSNRRAAAVQRYLVDLGVSSQRVRTVGYGEARPANPGSGEDAWAENRRVEFSR